MCLAYASRRRAITSPKRERGNRKAVEISARLRFGLVFRRFANLIRGAKTQPSYRIPLIGASSVSFPAAMRLAIGQAQ